jgi:hypothetical protein
MSSQPTIGDIESSRLPEGERKRKKSKNASPSEDNSSTGKFRPPQNESSLTFCFHRFVNWTTQYTADYHGVSFTGIFDTFRQSIWKLFLDRTTWSKGVLFIIIGLGASFVTETTNQGPRYNSVVLLVVMASIAYPNFPKKTVRPQVVISLLVAITWLLDIYFIAHPPRLISNHYKAATIIAALSKLLALYDMLWLSKDALRAKKYIHRLALPFLIDTNTTSLTSNLHAMNRRIRIFFIPCSRPRKVMREARSRVLAAAIIQLVRSSLIMPLSVFTMEH